MFSVQVSNGVAIHTTDQSKDSLQVETTASQSVTVTFPRKAGTFDPNNEEEDHVWQLPVHETYVTKIVNDKLETTAQEALE